MTPLARRTALMQPLFVAIAVHAALAILQVVAALLTGSVAIIASALHIAIGTCAHIAALGGIWISTRPADERHPYGYERYEALSALIIGMLLLLSVAVIAAVAVPRLLAPQPTQQTVFGILVMFASAVANTALYRVLRTAGDRLHSQVLKSEAVHAVTDAAAALAVLLGLAASSLGLLRLDPIIALAIGCLVAWRAWLVIRLSTRVLTDVAPVDIEELRRVATAVPGVLDCHAVRSRGEAGRAQVDLHIHVAPDLTVREAHAIAEAVQRRLVDEVGGIAEVLVHIGAGS